MKLTRGKRKDNKKETLELSVSDGIRISRIFGPYPTSPLV